MHQNTYLTEVPAKYWQFATLPALYGKHLQIDSITLAPKELRGKKK